MTVLHLPWLELLVLTPLVGAVWLWRQPVADRAQRQAVAFAALTLFWAVGAWQDFLSLHAFAAHDRWDVVARLLGDEVLVVDELSAPLLPLAALLYLATAVATMRTKVKRFSFTSALVSESILLATLSCRAPWWLIVLLALGAIPPYLELRWRRKPTRVYTVHMLLMTVLLILGQSLLDAPAVGAEWLPLAVALLGLGVMVRGGIFPVHVWMTDLFEHASFGAALLYSTPMVGAYAALRLLLPVAADGALRGIALVALFAALYAAGMALVQREARRFFCYLFLSHAALVFVGLELATPIGLTGALSVWLSAGLAMTGFGLTLRSLEARIGRISLASYHGLYERTPTLAAFFLLTGLASVGFPGTFGFVGAELLVEGTVEAFPAIGVIVVLVAALNGIAVLQAYFRIFTGSRPVGSVSLRSRLPERLAVLTLSGLILAGGLVPQPGIATRYHAARELLEWRARRVAPGERGAADLHEHPPDEPAAAAAVR